MSWMNMLFTKCKHNFQWLDIFITTPSLNETCIKLVTQDDILMKLAIKNSEDLICVAKSFNKHISLILTCRAQSARSKRVATRKNIASCVHSTHNVMTSYVHVRSKRVTEGLS